MNYGEILSRAWQIIWKHKILWVFGILAGCTQAGSSGGSNSGIRFSGRENTQMYNRIFGQVDPDVWIIVAVVVGLVIIVLWLIAIFLGTIGKIGLVRGTLQAEGGAERLILGELFSGSMPYFWRVLGLNVLAFLVMLIVFPIVAIPVGLCTCGIGVLALLLFVAVYLEQANIAIVAEGRGCPGPQLAGDPRSFWPHVGHGSDPCCGCESDRRIHPGLAHPPDLRTIDRWDHRPIFDWRGRGYPRRFVGDRAVFHCLPAGFIIAEWDLTFLSLCFLDADFLALDRSASSNRAGRASACSDIMDTLC